MTLRAIASRLLLVGWLVVWMFASRRLSLPPLTASILALLFDVFGVIAGLYLFFHGFQLLQQKRWIEDTPVTTICAAAMGPVKVFGKATGPYTLLSPLASVDCYYYRAVAWNGVDAENDQELQGRATEILFTPFFVEDETGRLMVDPRGAGIELPSEYDEQISGDSMTECSRRFLRRHGLSTYGGTTVSEYAIKPGDPVLVLGTLGENRGLGSMADAEGAGRRTAYLSREAADLQRREELEALGMPITESTEPMPNDDSTFDLHPPTVLQAGSDRPFVLSRHSPQRMIDNLARRSVLDIWGGPVIALLSLALLLKWLAMG
jgi:E3 Ubiquitin ligase